MTDCFPWAGAAGRAACQQIGAAAGRIGHDQLNCPGRIIGLGVAAATLRRNCCRHGERRDGDVDGLHCLLPYRRTSRFADLNAVARIARYL